MTCCDVPSWVVTRAQMVYVMGSLHSHSCLKRWACHASTCWQR